MERLYKILTHDAQSAHGGKMDWTPYLPKYKWDKDFDDGKWIAGKWLKHDRDLIMCESGIHLTSHPLRWNIKRGRVFLAEYRGAFLYEKYSDKHVFSEVRLLCELGIDSFDFDVSIYKTINSYADLNYANLRSVNLRSVNLRSVNLSYADLRSANLNYANLSSADLNYADLRCANLSYANLSCANLSYANLRYADLNYADLRSANLRYANLRSADLNYADLNYAHNLTGAWIDYDPKIKGWKFENGRLWKE